MFWFSAICPESGEPLEVEAVYLRPRRGLRDTFGAPLEPDDREVVMICKAWDQTGKVVDFEGFREMLETAAWRLIEQKT